MTRREEWGEERRRGEGRGDDMQLLLWRLREDHTDTQTDA